ncbi:formimidoylglutamate deiminase [Pendulispora albinea]|uniref:Formimidoylglutamate deiminase n=1 Tax=Pendulispora albinea TaxID=2741071 RepID=A0ABZ2M5D3_9BACT
MTTPLLLTFPALATAHSHAFQRGMRGGAQRRGLRGEDDFWTWRGTMYQLANALTPESIARISRVAFRELRLSGVRTVGEFHYVHHQPDGTPYAQRTLLSDTVIEAAKAEGLRIALLRVAYHRAGAGKPAEPFQARFCDPSVDAVLSDVDALRAKYKNDPDVRVGLAPHSVRAVPPSWLGPLAEYARRHRLPFHMHVAEQTREIDECVAETGRRPIELLDHLGVLSPEFVAVHATHLTDTEAKLLGAQRSFACICATTERDLGDGLPSISALRAAQVRLCTGVDSHVMTDPFEDMRSLETLERLRTQSRVTFSPDGVSPAEQLWREASLEGAAACGFPDPGGDVVLRRDHPSLELVSDEHVLDAIVFGGGPALVERLEPAPRAATP